MTGPALLAMTGPEFGLALLGAGGLTAIVNAIIAGRTAVRTAEAATTSSSTAAKIEDRKLDMAYYKDIIAERNAELVRVRADCAEERSRFEADLAEERALNATLLSSRELEHAEVVELRALLAAATRPPEASP